MEKMAPIGLLREGDRMNTKYFRIFKPKFYILNYKHYKDALEYDKKLYLAWSNRSHFNRGELNTVEWKYMRCFRKAQVNKGNIWWYFYSFKLDGLTRKTGIWIPSSITCGKGMLIGHWGRIIVNPSTIIGDDFFISSGVTIGRDVRGQRIGVPEIGNRVCIKNNAALVGRIKIGNDVLIAPNAFVNFDVPDHSVVVGNPGIIHYKENATEGHIGSVVESE